MTSYFAPIARLLGDLVVSLPPLQSLLESDGDLCLIVRSPAQEGLSERIPGLKRSIRENDFLKLQQTENCKIYNLRDHPLQKDFVWGSPEFNKKYPGYKINNVISKICQDYGIADGQKQLKPLSFSLRDDCRDKVLFIPGTAGPIKRWPSQHWLQLHEELKQLGVESLMIGEPRYNMQISSLMKNGMPWHPTPLLTDALDAVSSAKAVVSVDTGLMHLAVHQGVKTITLSREYTMFLRPYDNARYLIAPQCNNECREREFGFCPNVEVFYQDWNKDKIFDYWNSLHCQSAESETCMNFITVQSVLETLKETCIF